MTSLKPKPMTVSEFLAWEVAQPEKWELVDGRPVLRAVRKWGRLDVAQGMAGGTVQHGVIAANIIAALKPRLRGGPCLPIGSDVRVATAEGAARYPDVTVDCGERAPGELLLKAPRLLFEMLSPANSFSQQLLLLEEYQAIASVAQIVFVAQTEPLAHVWTREGQSWRRSDHAGQDAVLALDSIGCELPLAEV